MTLVTIRGHAWTHQGEPILQSRMPELFLVPKAHSFGGTAIFVGVEAKADLNPITGFFTVEVEADSGIYYQPVMRWRVNWRENDPEKIAYGYAEWPFLVAPGEGGLITDLIADFPPGTILVGVGEPPIDDVVWIDITDQNEQGALVYAPEGTV